jgi:hypothetical protein
MGIALPMNPGGRRIDRRYRLPKSDIRLICSLSTRSPSPSPSRLPAIQHEGRDPRDLRGVHGAHVGLPHGRTPGHRPHVRPDPGSSEKSPRRGLLYFLEVESGPRFRRVHEKVAGNILLAVRTLHCIQSIGWHQAFKQEFYQSGMIRKTLDNTRFLLCKRMVIISLSLSSILILHDFLRLMRMTRFYLCPQTTCN